MTIKGLLSNIVKVVASKASSIGTLLMGAKLENVVKAGLFVGASAYTGYVLISSAIEKRQSYKIGKNMSNVDRALALNYADKTNRKHLSPIFDDINNAFDRGRSEKYLTLRKLTKADRKELDRISQRIDTLVPTMDEYGDYYYNTIPEDLEQFIVDMKEVKRMDKLRDATEDEFTLSRIWRSPAY